MQFLVSKEKENKDKKSILQKDLSVKEILAVVGVFGAIFVYGYVFIYPNYTEYKASVINLQGIESQVYDYESKINEMPIKEERLDSLNKEIKVKSRMLSHDMEDGMFLIGLSKLMSTLNVDLVEYTIDESMPYETFYAIPTTISVRGDYRHIREIMYYMEEQKNMTQILDYSMQTYIAEETKEDTTKATNTTTSNAVTIVPDDIVYWTDFGAAYHKESCQIINAEKQANGGKFLKGSPSTSGKSNACDVCKPYTTNQIQNQQQQQEKPKPNGIVEAEFKFIMYSSENPILELNNDDYSKWKPGKYNPFKSTI